MQVVPLQEVMDLVQHLLVHVLLHNRKLSRPDEFISLVKLHGRSPLVHQAMHFLLQLQVHFRIWRWNAVSPDAEFLFVFRLR
ncbi:hypothetical protein D3C85_1824760 [compost metagenome]